MHEPRLEAKAPAPLDERNACLTEKTEIGAKAGYAMTGIGRMASTGDKLRASNALNARDLPSIP